MPEIAPLTGLDEVQWQRLTHAYGTADGVPALLRALRTEPPNAEEGALWELFGNIWHQGTVYEATAYAVPFLLEIAAHPGTPNRVGVLHLLSAIAKGASYRAVHGRLKDEPDFEARKQVELGWVAAARGAVAAGYEILVAMTAEPPPVRLAAAHVLAQLEPYRAAVAKMLREFLRQATVSSHRAAFLTLLGDTRDQSPETIEVLLDAISGSDRAQHIAAVFALARLKPEPMPTVARDAILAMATAEELEGLEEFLQELSWDAGPAFSQEVLVEALDESGRHRLIENILESLEAGRGNHEHVDTLLDLLFSYSPRRRLEPQELSPLQARAVRALVHAMKGGKRIYYSSFTTWGLPDTQREWNALAAGAVPSPVDETLPLFADPSNPRRALDPDAVGLGQRIVHRYFGTGTVIEAVGQGRNRILTVEFDEEGTMLVGIP